jgi:ElaB/YqjD/DUF883 family membrane-anchored ribosome-binding protein
MNNNSTAFEIREALNDISMLLDVLQATLETKGNESRYFQAKLIKERLQAVIDKLAN